MNIRISFPIAIFNPSMTIPLHPKHLLVVVAALLPEPPANDQYLHDHDGSHRQRLHKGLEIEEHAWDGGHHRD